MVAVGEKRKKNVRLSRKRADELIGELLGRVELVNEDPQYIFGISRVSVFGSYLTDKEKLGDLDIAVEVGPKCRDRKKHDDLDDEQCAAEGRGNMVDRVYWPQTKPLRALRGKNTAFSFTTYGDLERLIEQGAAAKEIYRNEQYDRKSFYEGARASDK